MSTRRPRWWRRARTDEDFHAEIQAHIDLEAEQLRADGIRPADARDAARRTFGNVGKVEEQFFEASRWIWLEQMRQDVRYAVRTLWRSRTFVATTVVTLAIALSLVTVIFALFNAYVLRPFAIPDPYRVYQLTWQVPPDDGGAFFTWREYQAFRDRGDVFEGAVAHRFQMLSANHQPLYAAFVSGNYFDTLRPRMQLGRPLAEFDTTSPGGAAVAVLSDPGWAALFDRDPNVVGRRLELHGQQFEIVGVTRPEFSGLDDAPLDLWLPITMLQETGGTDLFGASQPRELTIFARLRHDVTAQQADEALSAMMLDAASASRRSTRPETVRAAIRSRATPNALTFNLILILSPIFAAFALVLVAACANVSSVMLARAMNRQREIGIRLSVGASRGRIVRQLLTEAAIVAILAGALGLAIARFVLPAGRWMFFRTLPSTVAELVRVVPLEVDGRVFAFALGIAAVTTMLCALVPALQATRLQLTSALRGEVAPRLRSGVLRNVLVIGQVTVSIILLIGAATLARNGVTIASADLGYDVRGIYSINQRGANSTLIPAAAEVLAREPAVEAVAVTSNNPLFGAVGSIGAVAADGGDTIRTAYIFVSPGYFPLLRIPLLRGRPFSDAESHAEAAVGIISARTSQAFWGSADPVGRVLKFEPSSDSQADAVRRYREITVIGVAKDVVTTTPYEGVDAAIVYLPTSRTGSHAGALLARVAVDNAAQRTALRESLERVAVNRAALEVISLAEVTHILLYPLRVASWIGSLLGVIALALSVSGLYGLLTYVLAQRTREIGIRMALGATAARVVQLIVRQSVRVVAVGAGLGLALSYAALRVLMAVIPLELRNVSLFDVWSFAIAIGMVGAAALVASYFPARRATRVDPHTTLRSEG
jgi:predicted permease